MKFLALAAIVVLVMVAVAAFLLVRKLRKPTASSTQSRIVASVGNDLTSKRADRAVRPTNARTAPVVEYRKSTKPSPSKPAKSKASNDDLDWGYYADEPSYYSQYEYDKPASTYAEPTRYEAPSTPSYDYGSSSSSSSSDSGSSSGSSSSSYDSGSSSSSSGSSDY